MVDLLMQLASVRIYNLLQIVIPLIQTCNKINLSCIAASSFTVHPSDVHVALVELSKMFVILQIESYYSTKVRILFTTSWSNTIPNQRAYIQRQCVQSSEKVE